MKIKYTKLTFLLWNVFFYFHAFPSIALWVQPSFATLLLLPCTKYIPAGAALTRQRLRVTTVNADVHHCRSFRHRHCRRPSGSVPQICPHRNVDWWIAMWKLLNILSHTQQYLFTKTSSTSSINTYYINKELIYLMQYKDGNIYVIDI